MFSHSPLPHDASYTYYIQKRLLGHISAWPGWLGYGSHTPMSLRVFSGWDVR